MKQPQPPIPRSLLEHLPLNGRLSATMRARQIVHALGGHWHGSYGMACCPAHDDSNPSLCVTPKDGRLLVYCHAGCRQVEVLSALSARGLQLNGLPQNRKDHRSVDEKHDRLSRIALNIWKTSVPAAGTLVERYLRRRSIEIPVPEALRFHPELKHQPSGAIHPAMVALVLNAKTGQPAAIHRTFLAGDGTQKAAVPQQKMLLGPCRGGVVRLAPARDLVLVAEGIETALSAMQATSWPAWAALSASLLQALELPPEIKNVIVLADGDEPGEAAAVHAASRWRSQGRRVHIARAPRGLDFNDVLRGDCSSNPEG